MKAPNLQSLLKKWQKRLRLQDWDITAKYDDEHILDGQVGLTRFSKKYHHALIRILHPKDNFFTEPHTKNVELTLVHELLHLHITPLGEHPEEHEELVVETLAKAFLSI